MINKIIYSLLSLLLIACSNNKQEAQTYSPPKPSNQNGEQLAKNYCSSCHLFPEPALLDKNTWQRGVLPQMALRLGMEDPFMKLLTMSNKDDAQVLLDAGIYPENPVLAQEDWQKIMDFYINNAPEKPIPQEKKEKSSLSSGLFQAKPILQSSKSLPLSTLVKFNPKDKTCYIGNRLGFIEKYDLLGKRIDSIKVDSSPSDIMLINNQLYVLMMGIMDPNDQAKGKLSLNGKPILEKLRRPVMMAQSDLNQDAKPDFIICNYGNELGNLSWYESETLKEHVLKPVSGARNVIIDDLNHDSLPDIVVLMAQAREGVFVLYNKGNGEFDEKTLLEFLPVYGSSYIELADFNKDGFQDILYSNGDNADYSYSPKAYHGIRVYLNDGKNNFKQAYFYPMYGASKAQCADFDLDGDLDIVGISFFPEKDAENFVYLENQGNLQFKPMYMKETQQGGLLVMDVADMDADGDSDIILGSFLRQSSKNKQIYKALLLQNDRK